MQNEIIIAKFEGRLADSHRLPAYQATESMFGIAKAITMSANYLFEDRVRRRRFEKSQFRLDILTQREGSFETVFDFAFDPELLKALGFVAVPGAVAGTLATDFIKSMFQKAVGKKPLPSIEALENERKLSDGDIAALVEAIEPSLKQAHKTIGGGASSITIHTGDHSPVTFDQSTKNYITYNNNNINVRVKSFSVGSFNANTGYGRVFDFEEGRTIPFQLPSKVDPETLNALLYSFNAYSMNKLGGLEGESSIYIQYTSVDSSDGVMKQIFPRLARRELNEI